MMNGSNSLQINNLLAEIARSDIPSADLMQRSAAQCDRFVSLKAAPVFSDYLSKLRAQAWLDASLLLLASELPTWSIRRIIRDDGRWHCSLSRFPELPIEIDDAVEATHGHIAFAVLMTILIATQRPSETYNVRPLPRNNAPSDAIRVCCENFS